MGGFENRVAVITGASHGIGLAIRKAFEKEGCRDANKREIRTYVSQHIADNLLGYDEIPE
ncbi:MAG: hypothetical protein K5908_08365 [Erysipelotrichaceae bacterium]|nr:hypothetical protein [Erysipelotrichaceae bacterium]